MKVTDLYQYELSNNLSLSGEAFAHECCLFTYKDMGDDKDEDRERSSVLYDLKSNQTYRIDSSNLYLNKGYDEDHLCLLAHTSARIFDRKTGALGEDLSVDGYSVSGGDIELSLPYKVFHSHDEPRKHQLLDLRSGKLLAKFTQPEPLQLIYSRNTPGRIDMRPHEIWPMHAKYDAPKDSKFTFLSYDIEKDKMQIGQIEVEHQYNQFLGYVGDLAVYFSYWALGVIVVSPIGEKLQTIPLDGYVVREMPMLGFSVIGDTFYLLYQAAGKPTLIEVNAKADSVKIHDAPFPKSQFMKSRHMMGIPVHDGKMIIKDRFICLDTMKGGTIEYPQKMKSLDRHFNYLGNGQFMIANWRDGVGIYDGFSLGAFEGSSLPDKPTIGEIDDVKRIG